MTPASPSTVDSLPKAELHLHLEGSIQPPTVRRLAARHGLEVAEEDVRERYGSRDFAQFIDAFKWVTSFLRMPQDYALVTHDLGEHLLTQGVTYAEVTLSVGVMVLREQSPAANFAAVVQAAAPFLKRGLRINWVFDAVRQFGAAAAMQVVEEVKNCGSTSIVAFGIGGDELSVPTAEFRGVYEKAAELGLRRVMHAGEVGGAEKVREAVELLGAERIGHGIAAINDPALMDLLAERGIPLEICPASNVRTGALARQLNCQVATIEQHPLPQFFRHGIPVVLSTDDPAMFETTLRGEYENAARMGLTDAELSRIVEMGFEYSFYKIGSPQI
jgi:aminodeoxyfutalosine deaminase